MPRKRKPPVQSRTYTAQLQQHQDEKSAADGGWSPENDTFMQATGPKLAEPGIDIPERVVPIMADQQMTSK